MIKFLRYFDGNIKILGFSRAYRTDFSKLIFLIIFIVYSIIIRNKYPFLLEDNFSRLDIIFSLRLVDKPRNDQVITIDSEILITGHINGNNSIVNAASAAFGIKALVFAHSLKILSHWFLDI